MSAAGAWATRRLALALTLLVSLAGCAAAPLASGGAGSAAGYTDEVFALSAEADRAYRESRLIDAARHYQRLTERVPEDAYSWFRLGNTYARQGHYERATFAYERSVAHDPEQPKAWFNLSTAYLLGAQEAMRRAWSRLRTGDPARAMIGARLEGLEALIHERIEEQDGIGAVPSRGGR